MRATAVQFENGFYMKWALKIIVDRSFCNEFHRYSISPCSTDSLICDVSEEVATEIAENGRRRRPHCYLTPPPRGTVAKICIHPVFSETRLIGLHFCRWHYGSIFIRLAVVASQNANLRQIPWQFAFVAVQGHPRSSILVPMESAHTSSY